MGKVTCKMDYNTIFYQESADISFTTIVPESADISFTPIVLIHVCLTDSTFHYHFWLQQTKFTAYLKPQVRFRVL